MNLKDLNKPVDIENIQFRIQSISAKGWCTVLAYKDARYDMNMLDKVVGAENWQKRYEMISGNLHCHVGIYNDKIGEWIWKSDVGTESMTEATKGQASDAFKRACFNWGIGRELYDFPRIFLQLKESEFTVAGSKAKQSFGLNMHDWTWVVERESDESIKKLYAVDENAEMRYDSSRSVFMNKPDGTKAPATPPNQPVREPAQTTTKFDAAMKKLVEGIKTVPELEKNWKDNPKLHSNKDYITSITKMKKKLAE
jgi:hypothetical protein